MALIADDMAILPRLAGETWRVPVSGGTLAVEVAGHGQPLLFIHGWTLDRRAWTPQVDALPGNVQSILFDRRGCGQSDAPASLEHEPEDVAALLARRWPGDVVIVAMSQGVRVALAFAMRHPERVRGLVLQGPPLLFPEADDGGPRAASICELDALAREMRWMELAEALRRNPLFCLPGGEGRALRDAMLGDYRARDLLSAGRPLHLSPDEIAGIRAPTLLICGEHEVDERKRSARWLKGLLADAEQREIRGGGHLCNLCSPAAYNAVLADFLAHIGDIPRRDS